VILSVKSLAQAILFCFVFGFYWISLRPHSANAAWTRVERLEAAVNSEVVLSVDIQKFKQTTDLRSQIDPLFANTPFSSRAKTASNTEIRDFLVDEKLILQQFPVTDGEVEQEINSIQGTNSISRDDLKSALKTQGFAFEDYYELIRVGASKRNLIDRDIRSKAVVSDEDIKNFYFNHYSKKSSAPVSYHIKLISINLSSFKKPEEAKKFADSAIKAVKSGDSFEDVAKRFSDDPSAKEGGDLGFIDEAQVNPIFRKTLASLQIGGSSDLLGDIKTGFFITKLVDKRFEQDRQFEKAKEEIRSKLSTVEYQRQIQIWLDRQRSQAYIYRVD